MKQMVGGSFLQICVSGDTLSRGPGSSIELPITVLRRQIGN